LEIDNSNNEIKKKSMNNDNNNNNNNNNNVIYIAPACRMTSEALKSSDITMLTNSRVGYKQDRQHENLFMVTCQNRE